MTPKPRKARTPKATPQGRQDLLPPGTLVCEPVVLELRPVPWKAPTVTRKGGTFKDENLVAYQEAIATAANEVLGPHTPYWGPVLLRAVLARRCTAGKDPGDYWAEKPDGDNCLKAIADSVAGDVFRRPGKDPVTRKSIPARFMPPSPVGRILLNDKQVVRYDAVKVYGTRDLVWFCFLATPKSCGGDPGLEGMGWLAEALSSCGVLAGDLKKVRLNSI